MREVFVEDGDPLIKRMFSEEGFQVVDRQEDAEIVCFGGGADVSPKLYDEPIEPRTYADIRKDLEDVYVYNKARALGQLCVGICRGGQFLHVMNGGKLIQHIEGHTGRAHDTNEGVSVTSDHHQAMIPFTHKDAQVTLRSPDGIAECIVYQNAVCYQPHPEWVAKGDECREYFFNLINDQLSGKD